MASITSDTVRTLVTEALRGATLEVDGTLYALVDLTQMAAALQPGATLRVLNGGLLTPIERASIATAKPGQVVFA